MISLWSLAKANKGSIAKELLSKGVCAHLIQRKVKGLEAVKGNTDIKEIATDYEGVAQCEILGDSLPFPKVLPMAEVPAGGYPESHDFNVQFTTMLNQLQAAWQAGNLDELENAIETMTTGLADAARVLMVKPLPSGEGNFGPSFQLAS